MVATENGILANKTGPQRKPQLKNVVGICGVCLAECWDEHVACGCAATAWRCEPTTAFSQSLPQL